MNILSPSLISLAQRGVTEDTIEGDKIIEIRAVVSQNWNDSLRILITILFCVELKRKYKKTK